MATLDSEKTFACTEALLIILQREHTALLAGDLDQIEQIVQAKRLAVAELEALGHDRAQANPRLQTVAAECARQNEVNGGMVEASLRHTQQVLAILQGQPPEAGLYSRTGTALRTSRLRPPTSV